MLPELNAIFSNNYRTPFVLIVMMLVLFLSRNKLSNPKKIIYKV